MVEPAEGLRERKKRQMRQLLSDTATQMFIDRGFDAVRVSEVAAACGVSEKTVFNYFRTKESLLLDRLDATEASLRTGLADRAVAPVQAALAILAAELFGLTSMLQTHDRPAELIDKYRRVGAMIRSTPSLRAHQSDSLDKVVAIAGSILAERAGLEPDAPEAQVAATALLALWPVQYRALGKYLDKTRTPEQIRQAVTAEVQRAARLVDQGLSSLAAFDGPASATGSTPSPGRRKVKD